MLALISDIHGNLPALEAVLGELAHRPVSQIVCLGDVAVFGPQPGAVIERLRELGGCFVMGNTDAYGIEPFPLPKTDERSRHIAAIESWSAAQLIDREREFLRGFAQTLSIPLANCLTLLAYHGSPTSYDDVILPDTPAESLDQIFAQTKEMILAGGHIHRQFLRRHRQRIIMNPGSVGLPFQQLPDGDGVENPAWAEYALLEMHGGQPAITFCRAPYDLEALVRAVRQSGMPSADWWLRHWRQVN